MSAVLAESLLLHCITRHSRLLVRKRVKNTLEKLVILLHHGTEKIDAFT